MSIDTKTSPLIILGLDSGDPDFIYRWAQEGYLRTIASILQRGYWARIKGPDLICQQGLWLSLFSGLSRGQHGYYYSRQLKPRTYELEDVFLQCHSKKPGFCHSYKTGWREAR